MVDYGFGFDNLETMEQMLQQLLDTVDPLESDASQITTSMIYDIAFGIYDHQSDMQSNPLASVTNHSAEQYHRESGLFLQLERYKKQRISDNWGLSLTEYLELPRTVVDMMTEIFISDSKDKKNLADEAERNAAKELSKLTQS